MYLSLNKKETAKGYISPIIYNLAIMNLYSRKNVRDWNVLFG